MPESVVHHRHAVELEPNSFLHLNDLGYSLFQAGQFDEAEEVLQLAENEGNKLAVFTEFFTADRVFLRPKGL